MFTPAAPAAPAQPAAAPAPAPKPANPAATQLADQTDEDFIAPDISQRDGEIQKVVMPWDEQPNTDDDDDLEAGAQPTAPATPANPDSPAVPSDEIVGLFGEDFGIQSLDDVKTKLPGILGEYNGYRTKVPELENQISELQSQLEVQLNPFANETIAGFNAFVKETGINDYGFYNQLSQGDLKEVDDIDVLILDAQKNGMEGISREDMRNSLIAKYNLQEVNYSNIEDATERAQKEAEQTQRLATQKIQLKMDANAKRKELMELKGKIKVEDPKAAHEAKVAERKKATEDLQAALTPAITQLINNKSKYPLSVTDKKTGQLVEVGHFQIPEADKNNLIVAGVKFITDQRLDPKDPSTVGKVNSFIDRVIKASYTDKMMDALYQSTIAQKGAEIDRQYHNPSGATLPHQQPTSPPAAPVTADQQERSVVTEVLKELGG